MTIQHGRKFVNLFTHWATKEEKPSSLYIMVPKIHPRAGG